MSAIRKSALSAAALFLGLSALFVGAGTAAAEDDWNSPTANVTMLLDCEDDWNTPCP
ncbi:hypothetical protein [Actinophytocola algeriensis]|uniref:Uncharacterized protein n=1 Tax=Actinophytocola algeriensis TaxID=1768010 RepID=A0A7W7Q948_9PSEU|nr:hypothetical protein [Actinophytocola algeriensis]MBB4909321.1 hypothetical protein [Actinophytocola algeriensis]MBE1475311.1 hypothetical protein [Actinophytocola algeriensis]